MLVELNEKEIAVLKKVLSEAKANLDDDGTYSVDFDTPEEAPRKGKLSKLQKYIDTAIDAMKKAGWKMTETEREDDEGNIRYFFEMEYRGETTDCSFCITDDEGEIWINSDFPSGMSGNDEVEDPRKVPWLYDYCLERWKKEVDYYLEDED